MPCLAADVAAELSTSFSGLTGQSPRDADSAAPASSDSTLTSLASNLSALNINAHEFVPFAPSSAAPKTGDVSLSNGAVHEETGALWSHTDGITDDAQEELTPAEFSQEGYAPAEDWSGQDPATWYRHWDDGYAADNGPEASISQYMNGSDHYVQGGYGEVRHAFLQPPPLFYFLPLINLLSTTSCSGGTMRFGSTAKVLAECKYDRIFEWVARGLHHS